MLSGFRRLQTIATAGHQRRGSHTSAMKASCSSTYLHQLQLHHQQGVQKAASPSGVRTEMVFSPPLTATSGHAVENQAADRAAMSLPGVPFLDHGEENLPSSTSLAGVAAMPVSVLTPMPPSGFLRLEPGIGCGYNGNPQISQRRWRSRQTSHPPPNVEGAHGEAVAG